MLRLTNPIRRYDWGSISAIPDLLGVPPDGDPQAELWIGAHPDSPSTLADGRALDAVVRSQPQAMLGREVTDTFGERLPFLTKILAAESALSLQVHPDAGRAAAGYAAEEAAGVPRDARERRYRDPFHKPEMVVALRPFQALCGWRDPVGTRELMALLDVEHEGWADLDERLSHPQPCAALRQAVSWLLSGDADVVDLVAAVAAAARGRQDRAELATIGGLAAAHPGDPGVVVALLLNQVTLDPGQALYLPAGNVHAYLRGMALEVMATSDNVLRAGLTRKHIDPDELLRTVDWTPRPVPHVQPTRKGVWRHYRPGAAEFEVAWADLDSGPTGGWHRGPRHGPRVVLALAGSVLARAAGTDVELAAGDAVLVTDADGPLQVGGSGSAVVVNVPGVKR